MTCLRRAASIGLAAASIPVVLSMWAMTQGATLFPHGCGARSAARNRECFTLMTLRSEVANAHDKGVVVAAPLPADAWGTQVIIDHLSPEYTLRSGGPDQQFGTPDDLVWPSKAAKKYLTEACDSPWVAHE